GEVDDDVDLVLAEDVLDDVEVRDVGLDERHAIVDRLEVRSVARVRQEVERDDAVVGMTFGPVMDEVRADEAGSSGDEDAHGRHRTRLNGLSRLSCTPC